MMKKICPVCDLPVNEMNYCSRCRKVIRRPILWNTDYYLNEMRPFYKEQHESPNIDNKGNQQKGDNMDPASYKSLAQRPESPGTQKETAPDGRHNPSRPFKPDQTKTGKKPLASLAGFLIVMFAFNVVPKLTGTVERLMENQGYNSNYETAIPYDDTGFAELDEEEVKASGEACSGYVHFPVDGRQIAESMRQFFSKTDYGYQVEDVGNYSDNYIFEEEGGSISYYETIESFTFEDQVTSQLEPSDEGYVYQYVDINYDTATGELHDYLSFLKDREVSLVCLEEFLSMTEAAAGIPLEESSIPAIMEQARTAEWQVDGMYFMEGLFDINAYITNDGIRIYVSFSNRNPIGSQET